MTRPCCLYARFDPDALTYSAASLTTRAAQSAVRAGADLMLNVEARPTPSGVELRRLSVTNTHKIVVHETHRLEARQVVVAAGAEGPSLAEQSLGTVTHHAQGLPAVAEAEPADHRRDPDHPGGGADAAPARRGPDPHPKHSPPRPARLPAHRRAAERRAGGICAAKPWRTCSRRWTPCPPWRHEALELGRSVGDVPGAWLALPEGGWPCYQPLSERHWLLLGGERADVVGAGVARELADKLLS